MINCIVIDDEPLARNVLEKYIRAHPQLNLQKTCINAKEAYGIIQVLKPDLIFLDIQMPAISGIDLVKSLKVPPPFIFTTAYSEFASVSYELDAVDYLLKPITLERFEKSIDKFLKISGTEKASQEKNYIYIKSNGNLIKVFYNDILYAQSMKDYIKIVTVKGPIITLLTLKSLIELLPATQFIQTHRSYLVNTLYVSERGKGVLIINGHSVPIGEKFREQIVL